MSTALTHVLYLAHSEAAHQTVEQHLSSPCFCFVLFFTQIVMAQFATSTGLYNKCIQQPELQEVQSTKVDDDLCKFLPAETILFILITVIVI